MTTDENKHGRWMALQWLLADALEARMLHREGICFDGAHQVLYRPLPHGWEVMWVGAHGSTGPHREDGPAWVSFVDGAVARLEWWRDGVRDRGDGPAVIRYDADWQPTTIEYWRGGTRELPEPPDQAQTILASVRAALATVEAHRCKNLDDEGADPPR